MIKSKLLGGNIGEPGEGLFQNVDLILCRSFLRTKHSRRAVFPE